MNAITKNDAEVIGSAVALRKLPFNGAAHQILCRLDPPLKSYDEEDAYEYVVASASTVANEVYLFGANEDGEIQNWGELPGSVGGTMEHSQAISLAGYAEVL